MVSKKDMRRNTLSAQSKLVLRQKDRACTPDLSSVEPLFQAIIIRSLSVLTPSISLLIQKWNYADQPSLTNAHEPSLALP